MRDNAKEMDVANNSGPGRHGPLPDGVAGWSWGAFLFSWIWAIGNRTCPGLLGIVPGVGLLMRVVLGFKGREWAWRARRWDSLAHFQRVQRRWSIAGVCALLAVLALAAALALGWQRQAPVQHPPTGEQLEL